MASNQHLRTFLCYNKGINGDTKRPQRSANYLWHDQQLQRSC